MPTNKLTVLLVEDDEPKLRAVQQFLRDECSVFEVRVAQSLTAAIESIVSYPINFAIIDMSLPTYDFATDRAGGGRPQGFGGEDILRFIESESPQTKSVVLTQYANFGQAETGSEKTLEELTESLQSEMGPGFLGVIYYSGQHGEWRERLKKLITESAGVEP